ncbi:MAG TPA: hypothetical protein VMN60_09110 [Longimicrobiales bacterium]|nr:hypothetical protein [Longimicrobiales bacterium]
MTLPLFPPEHGVSVWDTSAIIALKENNISRNERRLVLNALRERVIDGLLFFPPEVIRELELFKSAPTVRDELVEWARSCQPAATSVPVDFEQVKVILNRVPTLVDLDASYDQADPYVIALALQLLNQGFEAIVVTEDRRDTVNR